MFYLLPLALAILAGAIRSRQLSGLLLWELRAVFLLPLALFASLLPFWLGTYWPDLIWSEDRLLLMVLQSLSRGFYLIFVLINLVWTARRTSWTQFCRHLTVIYLHLVRRFSARPHRVPASSLRARSQARDLTPLRLIGLILAIPGLAGQLLVLTSNQGFWPLSQDYLETVADPLLVEGIKNGALRLEKLISTQTHYPFLGRIFPWPNWTGSTISNVLYLSPTDLILALALFLILFSLFPARKKS